jgi:hypothetical protein
MRLIITLTVLALTLALSISSAVAQETEQDIINRYLQAAEKKHSAKLGWASINLGIDRINRHNNYNDFATVESDRFVGTNLNWLNLGYSLGAEFGVVFKNGLAWSLGGEYWLKMGDEYSGSFTYLPAANPVENPSSKIQVYGASTGLQYYLRNRPNRDGTLNGLAVRVAGTVGYYYVSWDVWEEYQNLNLATSVPVNTNTTYTGSAPGFGISTGIDYPLNLWGLALGMDIGYLHLNFDNVAWYNSNEEEIIASWTGGPEGRVDLTFSGVRGKLEIKRFFTW